MGIKTMLDSPCGDYYWMRNTKLDLGSYLGADIVSDIVAKNQKNYGSKGIEFRKLDITKDQLPKADVILCRDCLVRFFNKGHHGGP